MKIIALLALCNLLSGGVSESGRVLAGISVGRWDRFEMSVQNAKKYANPYEYVMLDVIYTSPQGRAVKFWGFYDGGRTWKIRFMPEEIGIWRDPALREPKYDAAFSDGSDGISGSFECVASDIPGMICADEHNPIWFGFRGGKHVLVRSFHIGDRFFASNWPEDKRKAFLDWAQSQGYNMFSVASHYLNRNVKGRGQGWNTPALWPLNAAEYRKLEAIMNDLTARRIMIYPFAGFFGQSSDFPTNHREQHLKRRDA